jgi:hypothetical protein
MFSEAIGRHQGRPAVPGAGEIDHAQIVLLDEAVQVHIDEALPWRGTPVPQQLGLDVLQLQRTLEKRVVVEINLADGHVVGRPPVGIEFTEEFR